MKPVYLTVLSKILGKQTRICALVPPSEVETPRVLYLLHGNGDDCTSWVEQTNIAHYAQRYKLAVIMPEVESSYYTDMSRGLPYFTYLSQELPALVQEFLGLSPTQDATYVAGASMGGYGALKWALTCPEQFAGCASLSGSVDIVQRIADLPEYRFEEFRAIFGKDLRVAPHNDLYHLAMQATQRGTHLRMLSVCGLDDLFLQFNRRFSTFMETQPYQWLYRENEGGHNWSYWNRELPEVLSFLLDGNG